MGSHVAVDNLSFDVKRGEIVGFLGPNVSGKTTTMRMLTSFYTPDLGSISINGTDTQESDIVTRAAIGYLPENNPLYEDMLVAEYLAFVAELRGLSGAERKTNMDLTVEETGIQEVFYRPIHELSKGFHQRVGLAQAILHRPSILVLDEPTEGLDPNQRITIRDLIRHLGGERTVLLSTHVMQEVENTCERVLVIRRGKLVANSPVQDLLQQTLELRTVHLEVEGSNVEAGLSGVEGVTSVESMGIESGRKRYRLSVSADADPEGRHLRARQVQKLDAVGTSRGAAPAGGRVPPPDRRGGSVGRRVLDTCAHHCSHWSRRTSRATSTSPPRTY